MGRNETWSYYKDDTNRNVYGLSAPFMEDILTQAVHQSVSRFRFIVKQIDWLYNEDVAGYAKLERQSRCRQENGRWQEVKLLTRYDDVTV